MNKKLVTGALALLIVAATMLGGAGIFGAESGAGTAADPVVTKSYVDAKIAEIQSSSGSGESVTFDPVFVGAGKKVLGGGGSELILRSGSATAVDNGVNGVSDLTDGKDLKGGSTVQKNHLLLVPRDDGRGILALTDTWVMIKGPYVIK